jgi:hypothetical protein
MPNYLSEVTIPRIGTSAFKVRSENIMTAGECRHLKRDPTPWIWLLQKCQDTNYINKYVSISPADPHNFVGEDNNINDCDESDDDCVNDDMDLCDSFIK